MPEDSYFRWLVEKTPTRWWHDSADLEELSAGLAHAASGVTTNPVLTAQALRGRSEYWRAAMQALPPSLPGAERAEALMRIVVTETAARLLPVFISTQRRQGYVCAQVNPLHAGNREAMLAQAQRYYAWAPNIAVKLPVTAAGLDVLEECAAQGITTAATASFTVAQVVAAAERFRRGLWRADTVGKPGCRCFPVVMIGRLDDYLREVALDTQADVSADDLRQAGLAVVKRAYQICQERGYEATLIIAALRGIYHMTELAGADLVVSVHPTNQVKLLQAGVPREQRIEVPGSGEVLARLQKMPEFVKAYEPDCLRPEAFIAYGVTQRTLSQFSEVGWKALESTVN